MFSSINHDLENYNTFSGVCGGFVLSDFEKGMFGTAGLSRPRTFLKAIIESTFYAHLVC